MHIWQLCHLGMVVPLSDAYYQTENPESVGQDKVVMKKQLFSLKRISIHYIKISIPYHQLRCIYSATYQHLYSYIFCLKLLKTVLVKNLCISMQLKHQMK